MDQLNLYCHHALGVVAGGYGCTEFALWSAVDTARSPQRDMALQREELRTSRPGESAKVQGRGLPCMTAWESKLPNICPWKTKFQANLCSTTAHKTLFKMCSSTMLNPIKEHQPFDKLLRHLIQKCFQVADCILWNSISNLFFLNIYQHIFVCKRFIDVLYTSFCTYFVNILLSCFYTSCLFRRVVYYSLQLAILFMRFQEGVWYSNVLFQHQCVLFNRKYMLLYHIMEFTMIKGYAAIVQTEHNGDALSLLYCQLIVFT